MKMTQMKDVDLSGQRVLIREDLNVPIKDGKVGSDARIRASLPTIQHAHEAGAMVMLMSHIGRPIEGQYDEAFSLQPVAEHLSALLDHPVRLEKDWIDGVNGEAGDIILCENVRFNVGEKADDASLAKKNGSLVRCFCHGCLWDSSSCASIHTRRGKICPDCLCGSAACRRVRGFRESSV